MSKRTLFRHLAGATLLLLLGRASSAQTGFQIQKLIESYPTIPADDRLAIRAQAVFMKLRIVADKKPHLPPILRLLRVPSNVFALAGEDGTILVTEGALKLCYREGTDLHGDNLLAFVIAHELAHLAREDFSHASAFAQVEGFQVERGQEISRQHEIEADRTGVVYMWMAGFDPKALIGDNTSFFEAWVSQASSLGAYLPESHPSSQDRADYLMTQVREVLWDLDYFEVGSRLFEIGDYELAVPFFKRFATSFPGRAVLNNLGLCHLQLAVRALAVCDKLTALRFRTPGLLDKETIAFGTDRRGKGPRCLENAEFLDHKKAARELFEASIARDPGYVPAHVNLASLLLLSGDGAAALTAAKGLKELAPSLEADILEQLAYFLVGEQDEAFQAIKEIAVAKLRSLAKRNPDSALLAFNLAQLEAASGNLERSHSAFENLLRIEPTGPYADLARSRLAIAQPAPTAAAAMARPPCQLGKITAATRSWLDQLNAERKRMEAGSQRGTLYRAPRYTALEIGGSLVFVVERWADPKPAGLLESIDKTTPLRVIPTTKGHVRDYGGVAVEFIDGSPRSVVYSLHRP